MLIDAPGAQVADVASTLSSYGIHASFAVAKPSGPWCRASYGYHDQALPRLPDGGLCALAGRPRRAAPATLHDARRAPLPVCVERTQHRAVAGRPRRGRTARRRRRPAPGQRRRARALRPGEVVEFSVGNAAALQPLLGKLLAGLRGEHLAAVLGRPPDARRRAAAPEGVGGGDWPRSGLTTSARRRAARRCRPPHPGADARRRSTSGSALGVSLKARRSSAAERSSSGAPTTLWPRWTPRRAPAACARSLPATTPRRSRSPRGCAARGR